MGETLRVMQVMAGAKHGGAEGFFKRLVCALAEEPSVTQHVVTRAHTDLLEAFEAYGVGVTTAPFSGFFDVGTRCLLKTQIAQFQPDIVLTWMSRASQLCPAGDFTYVARLGGYYDLKYYQKADVLVGNTQDIVSYFHEKGWQEPYTAYLPNFAAAPVPTPPMPRAQFETPQDVPLLLTLGRLHQDKAFDVLIRALKDVPEAYLWIGGEGEEEAALKALAKSQGVEARVRFIGWQQDVSALFGACDVYVCPSRIEPLGNVILESWIHKRPVVAAASKGAVGLITPGKDGLISPLEDAHAMAVHLQDLIQHKDKAKTMAAAGFETYQEHFSKQAVVAQYLAFFERVKDLRRPHKKRRFF